MHFAYNPGQYGYRGHVINFPQNLSPIAQELPRLVSSMETLIIRSEYPDDNDYTDFRVRLQKVQDALLWLIQNNRYYAHLRINEDNLNSLPSDGNVAHVLPTKTTPNSPSRNDQGRAQEDDALEDEDAIMGGSFVPSRAQKYTETEHLVQAVRDIVNRNSNNTHEGTEHLLNWPTTSDTPINEFQTEGYISQAFPHLFPSGAADFLAPRLVKVKPAEYFKHLMKYEDGRFGRDPRFRDFALNACMRCGKHLRPAGYTSANTPRKQRCLRSTSSNGCTMTPPSLKKCFVWSDSSGNQAVLGGAAD
ncbi:hypothetical protein PsorP6_016761 [Peronosclerospora sorghi]|uniref:Uncharacterized protein n=1 Tax=Peronosclerospora sorghi TaxID=230839 RepID=A0ACC0WBZ4_9STRA|nr:hypothetical protein PsorP6_016761 [Peronosclerospora sorghi]